MMDDCAKGSREWHRRRDEGEVCYSLVCNPCPYCRRRANKVDDLERHVAALTEQLEAKAVILGPGDHHLGVTAIGYLKIEAGANVTIDDCHTLHVGTMSYPDKE